MTAFMDGDFLAGFFFVALALAGAALAAFFTPVFFVFLVVPLGVLLAAFLAGAFFLDLLATAGYSKPSPPAYAVPVAAESRGRETRI